MKHRLYWIARRFVDGIAAQSKYFPAMKERDEFVLNHKDWKKRGKICARNFEKHMLNE